MCNAASFVLNMRNVYYVSTGDHHQIIRELNGLPEDRLPLTTNDLRAHPCHSGHKMSGFTRLLSVEVLPPDSDYHRPFYEWNIHIDQDVVPVWTPNMAGLEERIDPVLREWGRYRRVWDVSVQYGWRPKNCFKRIETQSYTNQVIFSGPDLLLEEPSEHLKAVDFDWVMRLQGVEIV